MPNQNKCDHVVGIFEYCGEAVTVVASRIAIRLHQIKITYPRLQKFSDREIVEGRVEQFPFCPNCGAKIDWDKIKEACDAENNE